MRRAGRVYGLSFLRSSAFSWTRSMTAPPYFASASAWAGMATAKENRPVSGVNRPVRAALRHWVSMIRSGTRSALGIIFHDAP